jgi:hypothetical protein
MKCFILACGFLILVLCSGCKKDFLAKAPGVDVTIDTIFSNITFAERYLWGAYACLPYGLVRDWGNQRQNLLGLNELEDLTDLGQAFATWTGVVNTYYNGAYNATTGDNAKYSLTTDGAYDGIRRCWVFINNIDKVPGVDPGYVKQLKAEAGILIAFNYAHLFRHFGGVPWLTHAYDINDEVGQIPRLTAQQTCDSIISYCDKYAPDLPWVVPDSDTWDGRVTRYWAMAIKARTLLFNASPLFNDNMAYLNGDAAVKKLTWHGGYDINLWKKAADAARELISQCESSGDFSLYKKAGNSFRKDFQEAYFLRNNKETIISIRSQYFQHPNTSTLEYAHTLLDLAWANGAVTDEYVQMFPMANGISITDPSSGYDPANPYVNRDPRLYETVLVNGDAYRGRTAELWSGGQEARSGSDVGITGYRLRKFNLDQDAATLVGAIVHFPNLRLPEIYLSYAEATNEFNGGPNADAYKYVNLVRNRVGLNNLPLGLTKEQFREAILKERACEFGWEEVRWFDLVRWKRENDFKKRLHGMKITRSATMPYTFSYSQWTLPVRYWMTNWSPKWYLSAFPQNEVMKGYGLIQNPGW